MKYRLIKCYPGSPGLGTEVIKNNGMGGYSYGEPSIKEYSKQIIENNLEFWEEVVEKDYEILSVLIGRSENHQKRVINSNDFEGFIMSLIKCDGNSIHSVKRLSDNEIFTVGEKVNFQGSGCSGEHSIKEFILEDDYIAVNGFVVEFPLKNIEKLPKVLFTTEDGVDIYKGDNYCKVNNHSDYSIFTGFTSYGFQDNYEGLKFSTERKAEEYVLMNKPCLSINDVSKFYKRAANGKNNNSKGLIELARNKQTKY